jgi:hypothetical protein
MHGHQNTLQTIWSGTAAVSNVKNLTFYLPDSAVILGALQLKNSLILASVFTNIRDNAYDAVRFVYHIAGSVKKLLSVETVLDPTLHKHDIGESLVKAYLFLSAIDGALPIEVSLMEPSL